MLEVRDVSHAYGAKTVLDQVNLQVNTGEIVCLLGPSGCGKTTLLRIIAGLETSDTGKVYLDGKSLQLVPVHQRGFGFMFQDFALFPHMDVADNIAFGLKMQRLSTEEQQARVGEMLAAVNLRGFEQRDVSQLSGGERQRVALARSLAPNPRFLMLDEPLGSLDAALREELIGDLRSLIKQVGLTALYVTHDQREAFAIADRIAVMNAGQIEQIDTPINLYQHPTSAFVARFLGLHNLVPVLNQDGNKALTKLGTFEVDNAAKWVLLHPDQLHVVNRATPTTLTVIVREVVFQGDHYRVQVQHTSGILLTFKHPALATPLTPDSVVQVAVDGARGV
jgi:ABC-type Fe3+/spermidine/putrescine transport system ATPase subunit